MYSDILDIMKDSWIYSILIVDWGALSQYWSGEVRMETQAV